MKLVHVITNMERTIDGKEEILASMNPNNPYATEFMDDVERAKYKVMVEMLRMNLIELRTILNDLKRVSAFQTGI